MGRTVHEYVHRPAWFGTAHSARLIDVISAKPPWWQATKTPKQGFIMGAFWLVLALTQWLLLIVDRGEAWPWVLLRILLAVLATALGVAHLASATVLRRRHRAAAGQSDREADMSAG